MTYTFNHIPPLSVHTTVILCVVKVQPLNICYSECVRRVHTVHHMRLHCVLLRICKIRNKKKPGLVLLPMTAGKQSQCVGEQAAPAWSLQFATQPSNRFAPTNTQAANASGQWGTQSNCQRGQFCASAAGGGGGVGYPQYGQVTASAGGYSPVSSDTQQQAFFASGASQSRGLFAPQQFSSAAGGGAAAPNTNAYAPVPRAQGTLGGFNAQQSGVPTFDLTGSMS